MTELFEIRCPIHGFVDGLTEWEMDIIHHPVFQRLRRIRQLAWTEMVYPAAMHTRFEHSLGVMHLATRMFDEVWHRQEVVLKDLGFDQNARHRDREIVRIAALLHDVGHGPFSHAGEEVMPFRSEGKRWKHEDYSVAIIRNLMTDVLDDHVLNQRAHNISAAEIAHFLENKSLRFSQLFWRQLVASQLDADRADYLLRDSHHIGVEYGKYDLNRLLISLVVGIDESDSPVLAVSDGGLHTAVQLIIARYMMFTQVYFHKTRMIFDYHFSEALKQLIRTSSSGGLLPDETFPPPNTREHLESYLKWTDWRVLGMLAEGSGGEHAEILLNRGHYRLIHSTTDHAEQKEEQLINDFENALVADKVQVRRERTKSRWYKQALGDEIQIASGSEQRIRKRVEPLSSRSDIVKQLQAPMNRHLLYVHPDSKSKAAKIKDALIPRNNK